ncbi:EAL domain-containing response regulator [Xanthobacter tagetidis]|nr:EAL domain-containing response regulator [Xanthobacter tagetidis]MBB6310013.1 EAL domain-containing protein (putative c-di-GMP-specific phosphodiesterase class I) [Xanthobacter tagetidis]
MPNRVLVLDDDEMVAGTICSIFERMGYEARVSGTAADFYADCDAWGPTHLAIDLVMPDVDGVEVLLELSRRKVTAGIIITSGAGSRLLEAAQRVSTENGLNVLGVLSKPFLPRQLKDVLSEGAVDARPAVAPAPDRPARFDGEDLSLALRRGEFVVHYQPKIACRTGELRGFEALVRWQHPHFGLIPPSAFISLAEECGQIGGITDFVFEQSVAWLSNAFPGKNHHIAVNLSPVLLGDVSLADHFQKIARRYGISNDRVMLEITETSAMKDPTATLGAATRMRLKGFRLSIDDFGVGYSSLVQLIRIPFSEMKIDISFVRDVNKSEEARKVVIAIAGLAKSLGMEVTAEGVEDSGVLDFIRGIGCEMAQGYRIGRPMPGEAAALWSGLSS